MRFSCYSLRSNNYTKATPVWPQQSKALRLQKNQFLKAINRNLKKWPINKLESGLIREYNRSSPDFGRYFSRRFVSLIFKLWDEIFSTVSLGFNESIFS